MAARHPAFGGVNAASPAIPGRARPSGSRSARQATEVEASWAANIKENELMETRLLGTQGGLVQRNKGEGYQFEAEIYLEQNGCPFDMALHPPLHGVKSAMYHFRECILKNQPHLATGEEGLVVMELIDASAVTGQPIRI